MFGMSFGTLGAARARAGQFALDRLSAATAAAYSPRRLVSTYSGKAMRVRRSSDNVEADIGFTAAGDLDTVALLAHTGAGDGFVSKLYDQSGNGRDLAQATAANQPRIVLAGVVDKLNARPAVRTDGVDDGMATASFVIAQPFTRSSVIQFLNPASGWVLDTIDSAEVALYFPSAGSLSMYAGTTPQTVKAGVAANDKATVMEIYNGASSLGSYNGAVVATSSGTGGMNGLTVGKAFGPANYSLAMYADIIIFPTALSTNDRQSLEANQRLYYGTP